MAVRRSQNWLNQQRVDVPHMRSVESAIRNDFDELISSFAIGQDASYILRGFELNMVGAIGSSASSLQMIVENSAMFHGKSAQSGTFFQVASGVPNQTINSTTNTAVQGSFTPSSLNYIGLEFSRAVDNSTSAQVFLWNPTNKNEISKTVPLAQTLNYKIIVTSSIWASNVLPIGIVETDSSNNVLSVDDRRPMLFRLGSGGSNTPDPFHVYPWTNHAEGRTENYWHSSSATSPFRGGDKQILNFKEWADAVMSAFLEIKGTTYWYSANKGGSIIKLRGDLAQLQMTGSGKFKHAVAIAGELNWTSDVYLSYIGSRLQYKINAYPTGNDLTLADDEVVYLNLVRGVDVIPSLIFTQSSAIVTSVGAVSWTGDVVAGDYVKVGSEDDTKYYKIISVDSASQVTLDVPFVEPSTGSGGIQAKYAYGTYSVVPVPTTNRHVQKTLRKDVPFTEDVYWLFLRADNGGATARIYIRGSSGGELQQGEDREISDNQTLNILEYVGSPSEVTTTPDYTNSIVTGVAEQTTFTFPAASALTSGQSFHLNSALDLHKFYVWANINSGGGDPAPADLTAMEVALLSSDSALQVAAKFQAIIDASPYFDAVNNLDGTITVTNSQVGATSNATNVNMGGSFAIAVNTEGIGSFNHVIVDEENLTKSIKRLDSALIGVEATISASPYEEIISIISGSPSTDQEITGPVAALTTVKIPKNTRNSNVQETYVVGKADLQVYLNGNELSKIRDYNEMGTSGSSSFNLNFNFELKVGDVLSFRKFIAQGADAGGGSASGVNLGSAASADVFKQTIGSQLQFRRLEAGTNMTIVQSADRITFSSSSGVAASNIQVIAGINYTMLSTDDGAVVTNVGADRTITLMSAGAVPGKILYFKKLDAGNTLYIKAVGGQTLDGVDIDAAPFAISLQFESLTIMAVAGQWIII